MRIGEIKTITRDYRTTKGNLYQIVSVEMLDIPEDMQSLYKPVMYGTINHSYIDGNGTYSANLVKAQSERQAIAYYTSDGYTVAGCCEPVCRPKPGQPIVTIPADWTEVQL